MNYEIEFFIDQSLKIPEQKVEGDNVYILIDLSQM